MQSKWDAGGKSKESGPKEEFEWASGVQVLRGGSTDSCKAPSPSLLPICRKTGVRTGPWTDKVQCRMANGFGQMRAG